MGTPKTISKHTRMEAIPTFSFTIALTLIISSCINVDAKNSPIGAIYQFGDSISDTGNMVYESGHVGCAMPPYGESAFRQPTGRCSDGLLMVDHFAKAYRLPLLSPYLDRSGNFSHGANFAVVGATALSSLPVQLGWFKTHLSTICPNPYDYKKKLRNALFIMGGIGGNDYGYASSQGKNMQDMYTLAPQVVQAISSAVKEVIDLGARRIVVPGSFPVGCMPICLGGYESNDPSMYDELGCERSWNELAAFHNGLVQQAVKSLQQQNPGVKIIYGDYFGAMKLLLRNAAYLGFDKNGLHEACCSNCGSSAGRSCPNPNIRVSWDGIHMTQHAYRFIAQRLLTQIRLL